MSSGTILIYKLKHRGIRVRGTVYPTVADCAAALGVSRGAVRDAIRRGRLDALGTGASARPVTVHGTTYPSAAAAARACGVTEAAVRAAARRGTLDRLGCGRPGCRPMRVRIAGEMFDTVDDAARAFAVTPGAVYQALCQGDPDRIARAKRTWRDRPLRIGPLTFGSMAEADRLLGFRPGHISLVLRRGAAGAAWSGVLRAAMVFDARLVAILPPGSDGVRVGPLVFDTIDAAARVLGVSASQAAHALRRRGPAWRSLIRAALAIEAIQSRRVQAGRVAA